jgi:hypothetical protein
LGNRLRDEVVGCAAVRRPRFLGLRTRGRGAVISDRRMVRSGRELERGTRTAPFPANVRASCGARFLVAFPKFARRLAFSSKGNCQTIGALSDLASKGPGRSQLSHGDARLASCFKSSPKRETIGPKSDNEARTRGNRRPENCSFIVKSIAGAQRRLLRERCDELTSIHE